MKKKKVMLRKEPKEEIFTGAKNMYLQIYKLQRSKTETEMIISKSAK